MNQVCTTTHRPMDRYIDQHKQTPQKKRDATKVAKVRQHVRTRATATAYTHAAVAAPERTCTNRTQCFHHHNHKNVHSRRRSRLHQKQRDTSTSTLWVFVPKHTQVPSTPRDWRCSENYSEFLRTVILLLRGIWRKEVSLSALISPSASDLRWTIESPASHPFKHNILSARPTPTCLTTGASSHLWNRRHFLLGNDTKTRVTHPSGQIITLQSERSIILGQQGYKGCRRLPVHRESSNRHFCYHITSSFQPYGDSKVIAITTKHLPATVLL